MKQPFATAMFWDVSVPWISLLTCERAGGYGSLSSMT